MRQPAGFRPPAPSGSRNRKVRAALPGLAGVPAAPHLQRHPLPQRLSVIPDSVAVTDGTEEELEEIIPNPVDLPSLPVVKKIPHQRFPLGIPRDPDAHRNSEAVLSLLYDELGKNALHGPPLNVAVLESENLEV